MFSRYAIFYTPAPGTPLAEFGADWLGWDSALAQMRPLEQTDDLDKARLTQAPRKYGFHGTIKPPFRLAAGENVDGLSAALADQCARQVPVRLRGLEVAWLGRFLALVPSEPSDALNGLAARIVQQLDSFRAPPDAAELAKRRARRLSPAQEANLVAWGYPHVLDQFRFHMTLTGRMDAATGARVHTELQAALSDLALSPYLMTGLTLMGEDAEGQFHQIKRYSLSGCER